jgi:hypothetical protein
MNIANFRSQLGKGGARPNQFLVTLTFPGGIGVGDQNLLVTSASLPGSNVAPAIVQYRGREVPLAGERNFDPWTISVLNDTDMFLRSKFEAWSDKMNSRLGNDAVDGLLPSSYMVQMYVAQLDRNDAVIRRYTISDAWPIQVGEVSLDYGQDNTISQFQVTFRYQTFSVAAV